MLIDAHTHLDKYSDDELAEVLSTIERKRILTCSVAVDPESFLTAEAIAARSELAVAGFGIHPWQASDWVDRLDEVEDMILRSSIIGEVGLDRRFVDDRDRWDAQVVVLSHFLQRATEQRKLVNLHCAGAEKETVAMLREHECERVIIHWYSGPLDVLREMINDGYMFTVGVEALHSEHIRQVADLVPDDQLLTETDNPGGLRWLTGEVGMPGHLDLVIGELARIRGVSPAVIETTVHANLARLVSNDPNLMSWSAQLRL